MTTMPPRRAPRKIESPYVPPFEDGDVMDQPTFHALYLKTPKGFRAELIEGIVHMASPVQLRHGGPSVKVSQWLGAFADAVEGTISYNEITAILAKDSEPQPDHSLIVLPEAGGQTSVSAEDYLVGAPELALEISNTSVLIDLHAKKQMYDKYGVREYIVVETKRRVVHWFVRRVDQFVPLKVDADGILKSKCFPGLWLDPSALFERSAARLLTTLKLGLATPEHAKFAAKLQSKLAKLKS